MNHFGRYYLAMNKNTVISLLVLPLLIACEQDSSPGLEIHDSKYVVIGNDGSALDTTPESWSCVLDQFTGLTWEVKTDLEGLDDPAAHRRGR